MIFGFLLWLLLELLLFVRTNVSCSASTTLIRINNLKMIHVDTDTSEEVL